MNERITDI